MTLPGANDSQGPDQSPGSAALGTGTELAGSWHASVEPGRLFSPPGESSRLLAGYELVPFAKGPAEARRTSRAGKSAPMSRKTANRCEGS